MEISGAFHVSRNSFVDDSESQRRLMKAKSTAFWKRRRPSIPTTSRLQSGSSRRLRLPACVKCSQEIASAARAWKPFAGCHCICSETRSLVCWGQTAPASQRQYRCWWAFWSPLLVEYRFSASYDFLCFDNVVVAIISPPRLVEPGSLFNALQSFIFISKSVHYNVSYNTRRVQYIVNTSTDTLDILFWYLSLSVVWLSLIEFSFVLFSFYFFPLFIIIHLLHLLIQDMSRHLDRQNLRKQMGFCLQENVYYEDLTLNDHLEFIGRLRDIPPAARTQQVCRQTCY